MQSDGPKGPPQVFVEYTVRKTIQLLRKGKELQMFGQDEDAIMFPDYIDIPMPTWFASAIVLLHG